MLKLNQSSDLFLELPDDELFEKGLRDVVTDVAMRYASRTDDELKRIVYLTSPMRRILRREKYHRENLLNAPLDFSDV